ELWLKAVRQHHEAPAGPLSELAPELQIARLVQRADIFAARLSPRKLRASLSATAAAKTAYFDEREQPDEAGAAIIKAVGIYPPGSFVRLVSGEVAIVLCRGKLANQPTVASIVDADHMPYGMPRPRHTEIASHRVVTGVAPHDVKVRTPLDRLLRLLK
ncbi:MAG TPA: phosphohydrolase, partial [Albitalea sp.]|nr:phosphohydrolase [Albitalea sp.]